MNHNEIRFDFDIRQEVHRYLKSLLERTAIDENIVKDEEFLKFIAEGVKTIEGFIKSLSDDKKVVFGNFIYNKVNFVFNIAPENTDLNALFTALGSSGIQLSVV